MGLRMIHFRRTSGAITLLILFLEIYCSGISFACDQEIIPNEVVKQILRNPKLNIFFHPEIEERVPIVIQSNFVDPNIQLILYDKHVVVVPDLKKHQTTNIYMSFFENGTVNISYPVEGVKGIFRFDPDNKGSWVLKEAKIWEE